MFKTFPLNVSGFVSRTEKVSFELFVYNKNYFSDLNTKLNPFYDFQLTISAWLYASSHHSNIQKCKQLSRRDTERQKLFYFYTNIQQILVVLMWDATKVEINKLIWIYVFWYSSRFIKVYYCFFSLSRFELAALFYLFIKWKTEIICSEL